MANSPVLSRVSPLQKRRDIAGYLFTAPAIIGFLAFCMLPMFYSLYISFTEWNMMTPAVNVGWDNYIALLQTDKVALKSLQVTIYFTALCVPVCNIYALMMATLLNSKARGLSVYRTIFYIPSIVPAVAAAALWKYIFNPQWGLMNSLVALLGMRKQPWITSPTQVIPCLVAISAWGSGGTAIIYLAGLQGIPQHLYEAIEVDGGTALHKFFHVTLPMLSPVIFYNLVMGVIGNMQAFTAGYMITDGGPNNASLFYVLLLYNRAFEYQKMGIACAMAWVLFVIIGVLTAINFVISKKWVYYEEG
jgi:multiple sugar transport system permease protein